MLRIPKPLSLTSSPPWPSAPRHPPRPATRQRLHRPGRGDRVRLLVHGRSDHDLPRFCHASDLAVSMVYPTDPRPDGLEKKPGEAGHHRRARRPGPEAHPPVHGAGSAPQLRAAGSDGQLLRPPDDLSGRVSGRLVLFPDRVQPGAPQGLRLPGTQSQVLPAGALFRQDRTALEVPHHWPLQDSARKAEDSVRSKEPVLLENPR